MLAEHQRLLRAAAVQHGGVEVDARADEFFFAFAQARNAIAAALEAQRALGGHAWPPGVQVRVRMGLHTGHAEISEDGGYQGLAVHRAARIGALGHGGQVLLSQTTHDVLEDEEPLDGVTLRDLGAQTLKDFDRPVHVYQAGGFGLPSTFPPLRQPKRKSHRRIVLAAAALLAVAALAGAIYAFAGSGGGIVVRPNSLAFLDARTGKITADVALPGPPGKCVVRGGNAWVTDYDGRTLYSVDVRHHHYGSSVGLGFAPSSVAAGSEGIWVAGVKTLALVDRTRRRWSARSHSRRG